MPVLDVASIVNSIVNREPGRSLPDNVIAIVLALGLLLLTWLVYAPGLAGPFILDDFWNLEPLGADGGISSLETLRRFVFSNTSGPTGRPVSMLSFVLNAQDWPADPRPFKVTNLAIHLLCGAVIGCFSLLLAQLLGASRRISYQIALLVMAAWLLHPLNVSTTLYIVQRMTQLMTLFAMLALNFYLLGRRLVHKAPGRSLIYLCLALFPFGLLSVLSKENGALLLLAIVAVEAMVFRGAGSTRLFRAWYRVGVLVPVGIVIAYSLLTLPENLALYETRHFSLGERLLTEARIVLIYLREIFLPNAIGNGVFHDDIIISTGLLTPITTLFAVVVVIGLVAAAIHWRKEQPVFSFAVLWFVVLHLLESTYLPLELYFEHRNYMAMVGPLFAAAWYLSVAIEKMIVPINQWLVRAMILCVVAVEGFSTSLLVQQWSDGLQLVTTWAEENPDSLRARSTFAEYLEALYRPGRSMEEYEVMLEMAPNEVTLLLQVWNHACQYQVPPPVTLEQIAANSGLEYYHNDIVYHLRELLENLQEQNCEFPELPTLERLFQRIGEFPMPDWRQVGYHVYFSDLYVYHGLLDPALINLTRAYEINPRPEFPLRQANLSASAGNFSDALVFIERAKEADRLRNLLLPSIMDEIEVLEERIRAQLPDNLN